MVTTPGQSDEPHANLDGPQANGNVPAVANGTPASSIDPDIKDKAPAESGLPVDIGADDRVRLVEVLKANLTNASLYRPAADGARASHSDATVLRFLRARVWDVDKAGKHFARTEAWRKQHNVDALFKTFDADEMESTRRFYPRWTGRRDKQGLPVYVYRLAALDNAMRRELDVVPAQRRDQRIIALYECMIHFVLPLCDHVPHAPEMSPISSVTTIIDLGDVALRDMWSLRNHLQQASTLATANYPETLHTIAIVNCPSFFPTVWGWVKGWFDDGTRRKVHILGKDPGIALRELIDEKDLPECYGGKLKWVYEDEPYLDDDIQKAIGQMPKGPVLFIDGSVAKP